VRLSGWEDGDGDWEWFWIWNDRIIIIISALFFARNSFSGRAAAAVAAT